MSHCLNLDAIVAIGHALEWRTAEGLSHLSTCSRCRAELEMLHGVREAMLASEPVDEATLQRITTALRQANRDAVTGEWRRSRLRKVAEAGAAGVTGLIVVASNGVPIERPAALVVAFLLGAVLMMAGNSLARRFPPLSVPDATS